MQAFDQRLSKQLQHSNAVHIKVPSHSVWRNLRLNGYPLRPLPDGLEHIVEGPVHALYAGSFGDVLTDSTVGAEATMSSWYSPVESLVKCLAGANAASSLKNVSNKGQLVRWAHEYNGLMLLPKLLSMLSTGVVRGVP